MQISVGKLYLFHNCWCLLGLGSILNFDPGRPWAFCHLLSIICGAFETIFHLLEWIQYSLWLPTKFNSRGWGLELQGYNFLSRSIFKTHRTHHFHFLILSRQSYCWQVLLNLSRTLLRIPATDCIFLRMIWKTDWSANYRLIRIFVNRLLVNNKPQWGWAELKVNKRVTSWLWLRLRSIGFGWIIFCLISSKISKLYCKFASGNLKD